MKRAAILNAYNPEYYKGGIETFILNLIPLLKEQGIETDLHYIYPSPSLSIHKFPFRSVEKAIPPFLLECYMMGKAFREIEKNYYLVISNNFYGAGYYPQNSKAFNIYHSTHAGYADALKNKISASEFRTLKYFYGHIGDRIGGIRKEKIAVSNSIKDELERYYGFKNIDVVTHGIDTEFYKKMENVKPLRKKWEIPPYAFIGIFAGRWESGKGTYIVEETIKRHPDILWLLIVGNSECPITNLTNARIITNADKETMRELYSLADFMLFPSYYEGFGLAPAEAMSCELPIIATNTGFLKELHHTSILKPYILSFTDNNILENISTNIIKLLKHIELRKDLGNAARRLIIDKYSLSLWKDKIISIMALT